MAGDLVVIADGSGASTDRAGLAATVGEAGEVGSDDPLVRWQGCGAPGGAPGGEVAPVRQICPPGRLGRLRGRVAHGGVDLGGGQGAGQRRAEGDQVVHGGSGRARRDVIRLSDIDAVHMHRIDTEYAQA